MFIQWIRRMSVLVLSLCTQDEPSERHMLAQAESGSNFKDLKKGKKVKSVQDKPFGLWVQCIQLIIYKENIWQFGGSVSSLVIGKQRGVPLNLI